MSIPSIGFQTPYQNSETQRVQQSSILFQTGEVLRTQLGFSPANHNLHIPSRLIHETNPYQQSKTYKQRKISCKNGKYAIYTKTSAGKWVENISWSTKGIIKAYLNWNIFLNNYSSLSSLNVEEILSTMIPNHLFEGLQNRLGCFCGRLIDTRFLPDSKPFTDLDPSEFPEIHSRYVNVDTQYSNVQIIKSTLTEIVDVDVSIWHSIILTLNSDPSERKSDEPSHNISFNDIKKKYLWIAQNRGNFRFKVSSKSN